MERQRAIESISSGLKSIATELSRLVASAGSLKVDPEDPSLLLASDLAASKIALHTEGIITAAEHVSRGIAVLRRRKVLLDGDAKAEAIERQRLDIEEKTEKVREEIEELLPKINESRALKAPPAP